MLVEDEVKNSVRWLWVLVGALVACNERAPGDVSRAEQEAPPVECTTVCAEWGDPAAAFPDSVHQRGAATTADGRTCNALGAMPGSCPGGTTCVERSSAWSAFGALGPFCEVADEPIVVDVLEADGAIDVALTLTVNDRPLGRRSGLGVSLDEGGVRFRVTPDAGGRHVYYRTDPETSVANMRLVPGSYTLEFDGRECGGSVPFVHREARLEVTGQGETTLDLSAAYVRTDATVGGLAMDVYSPCPTTGTGMEPPCYHTDTVGSATFSGAGGARCVWSGQAPPLIQTGEVTMSVRLDGAANGIIGELAPQGLMVDSGGATYRADVAVVASDDVLALDEDFFFTVHSIVPVDAWVQGTYTATVRMNAAGGREPPNNVLVLPDQVAPPPTVRRFDEVTFSLSAMGSPVQSEYRVVALYETGESLVIHLSSRDGYTLWMPSGVAALYFVPHSDTVYAAVAGSVRGPALLSPAWDTREGVAEFELEVAEVRVRAPDVGAGSGVPVSGPPRGHRVSAEPPDFGSWPAAVRGVWRYGASNWDSPEAMDLTLLLPVGDWVIRPEILVDGYDEPWVGGALVSTDAGEMSIAVAPRRPQFESENGVTAAELARYLSIEEATSEGAESRPAQLWWRCEDECPPGVERGEFLIIDRVAY